MVTAWIRGCDAVRPLGAVLLLGLAMGPAGWAADTEPLGYEALWKRGEYRKALDDLEARIAPRLPNIPSFWEKERAELRFLCGEVDAAIADYEQLVTRSADATDTLRLAEMYRYRGAQTKFDMALADAARRLEGNWGGYNPQRTLLTAGRIAELQGDDPKQILSTFYTVLLRRAPEYVPGYVAAGNLALSKRSYAIAASYYEQALDRDPAAYEALAGLATCFWQSRDERLDAVLERLGRDAPLLPEGVAVRVEMALDAGRIDAALERIDAVLAINPNHRLFRAYRAAALFLADDIDGMKREQAHALAFNAMASEVYRIPGEVATRHYRFQEAAALHRQALAANADDHDARAELGITLLRLGRDEEGREALDRAFNADPYNVRVYNSLEVLDTLSDYARIEHGPFVLELPPDEANVLGPAMLDLLEEELALLEAKYAIQVERPLRIQIFDNHDDFMVRSLGLPGNAGHLGICFGRLVTMDSPSARPKGSMDWHSVLWHEFAHVITLQKTRNRMPRWLSEGISVHEETLRHPGWGMRVEPHFAELMDREALPGVSDLELHFTQPKTPQHLMLGYYLAGEFVKAYVAHYGQAALVDALERIAEQADALDALAAGAAVDGDALNGVFRAHLAAELAVLDRLPEFRAAMQRGAEAFTSQDWAAAEQAFQEAHALYPAYAESDGPLTGLAAIYDATGAADQLAGTLEAQLVLNTINLPAWRRLAELAKARGDWEAVIDAAAGAAAIDPFDVDLGRSLLDAQLTLERHEDALQTAARLAVLDTPRAVDHELTQVRLLTELDRDAEARAQVVRLLETRPHFWEAQEVLLALAESNSE